VGIPLSSDRLSTVSLGAAEEITRRERPPHCRGGIRFAVKILCPLLKRTRLPFEFVRPMFELLSSSERRCATLPRPDV
jgi:hypothetical protein